MWGNKVIYGNKDNDKFLEVKELFLAFNLNNVIGAEDLTNCTIDNGRNGGYVIRTRFSNDNKLFRNGIKQADAYVDDYFENFKRNLIGRFYTKDVGAKKSFDFSTFPFSISSEKEYKHKSDCCYVDIPVSVSDLPGLIFNLKSCVAHSLAKNIKTHLDGDIITRIVDDRSQYIMCSEFATRDIAKEFAEKYCWLIRKYDGELEDNDIVRPEGNKVYIKDVFDKEFIKSFVKCETGAVALRLLNDNDDYGELGPLRDSLNQVIYSAIGLEMVGYVSAPYTIDQPELGNNKNVILIPIVATDKQGGKRYLSSEEAERIDRVFCGKSSEITILNDVVDMVNLQYVLGMENSQDNIDEDQGLYGIDFYNRDIAHCVMYVLMEKIVIKYNNIDKKCELSVPDFHELFSALVEKISDKKLVELAEGTLSIADSGLGSSRQTSTSTVISRSAPSTSALYNQDVNAKRPLSRVSSLSESSESNSLISTLSSRGGSTQQRLRPEQSSSRPDTGFTDTRAEDSKGQDKKKMLIGGTNEFYMKVYGNIQAQQISLDQSEDSQKGKRRGKSSSWLLRCFGCGRKNEEHDSYTRSQGR